MAKNKPKKSEASDEPTKSAASGKAKPAGKTKAAASSSEPTKPTASRTGKAAASPGKAPAGKASAKPTAKPLTATELYSVLAERTALEKKKVAEFFEVLLGLVSEQIGQSGPGELKLPGLFKIKRKDVPARPETQRESPFEKGKIITVKARPASTSVKVQPLKKLTDSINPA
jgi:nucleoid DNA-binding protein